MRRLMKTADRAMGGAIATIGIDSDISPEDLENDEARGNVNRYVHGPERASMLLKMIREQSHDIRSRLESDKSVFKAICASLYKDLNTKSEISIFMYQVMKIIRGQKIESKKWEDVFIGNSRTIRICITLLLWVRYFYNKYKEQNPLKR